MQHDVCTLLHSDITKSRFWDCKQLESALLLLCRIIVDTVVLLARLLNVRDY